MTSTEPSLAATTSTSDSLDLFSLANKSALVTGGTRGIGAACALALASAGANVCLVIRPSASSDDSTHPALAPLPTDKGQRHTTMTCDLSDSNSVKQVIPKAVELNDGKIDILVNCAGIQRRNPSVEFLEEDWDEVIQVNLKSVWLLCQAAGQHMVPRREGKIINFGSLLQFQGGLTVPAYASAKGAVAQLTKALSNEWSKHNINVNAIAPGYIATDMNEKLLADPTRLRQISERIPAGRWGSPEDFKGPVIFLASDASKYLSGETIVVDGGWMGR